MIIVIRCILVRFLDLLQISQGGPLVVLRGTGTTTSPRAQGQIKELEPKKESVHQACQGVQGLWTRVAQGFAHDPTGEMSTWYLIILI